jgi:hypothetical protein
MAIESKHWLVLAESEHNRMRADKSLGNDTKSHEARIRTYVNTYLSMELSEISGEFYCSCCLKTKCERSD